MPRGYVIRISFVLASGRKLSSLKEMFYFSLLGSFIHSGYFYSTSSSPMFYQGCLLKVVDFTKSTYLLLIKDFSSKWWKQETPKCRQSGHPNLKLVQIFLYFL